MNLATFWSCENHSWYLLSLSASRRPVGLVQSFSMHVKPTPLRGIIIFHIFLPPNQLVSFVIFMLVGRVGAGEEQLVEMINNGCNFTAAWYYVTKYRGSSEADGLGPTLGLASVVHSMVTWVLTGAPISWLGIYIIGWTKINRYNDLLLTTISIKGDL